MPRVKGHPAAPAQVPAQVLALVPALVPELVPELVLELPVPPPPQGELMQSAFAASRTCTTTTRGARPRHLTSATSASSTTISTVRGLS